MDTPVPTVLTLSEDEIFRLVKEFQPILYQPQHDKYIPKFMYYRTNLKGDTLQITYYTVWDNERHPRYLLHILYAFIFRKFYYGSIKDIEYIQIDIDLNTRTVTDINFEDDNKPNYHVTIPFHVKHHLKRVPQPNTNDNIFIGFFGKKNQYQGLIRPRFSGKRVHMAITGWNHKNNLFFEDLGKYIKNLGDNFNTFTALLLKKYDPKEYKKYKAERRGKGDF
ncbi:MAG: hypothetical protein V1846_00485 [Candidatus Komeilibacteria bacterium]